MRGIQTFLKDKFESEKLSAGIAFILSVSIHYLLFDFAVSPNQVAEPKPVRMEAQVVIAELNPDIKPEEPLQITPQRDIANPEKAIIAKKTDIEHIKELRKSGSKGDQDNAAVKKGAALPVLASEESVATDANAYTVPSVPEENVDIVGESFGTKPAMNTGSIYGSEEGTKIGSIKDASDGNGSVEVITDVEYLWNVYGKKIEDYLKKNTVYPKKARMRSEQGMVIIRLHQLADGTTKSIDIAQSSGSVTLDKQAVLTLKKALKSVSLPDVLIGKNFVIEVPIEFMLRPH